MHVTFLFSLLAATLASVSAAPNTEDLALRAASGGGSATAAPDAAPTVDQGDDEGGSNPADVTLSGGIFQPVSGSHGGTGGFKDSGSASGSLSPAVTDGASPGANAGAGHGGHGGAGGSGVGAPTSGIAGHPPPSATSGPHATPTPSSEAQHVVVGLGGVAVALVGAVVWM